MIKLCGYFWFCKKIGNLLLLFCCRSNSEMRNTTLRWGSEGRSVKGWSRYWNGNGTRCITGLLRRAPVNLGLGRVKGRGGLPEEVRPGAIPAKEKGKGSLCSRPMGLLEVWYCLNRTWEAGTSQQARPRRLAKGGSESVPHGMCRGISCPTGQGLECS